ncbi:carbohydrate kinase family protein [Rhizosaccharibacter radicis]|uniref:Carbohydrate kinase n=1 Tax=Rhizosaccharibacter radicis TaxID=2782605 RepID=A0ABT1VXS3_9PROT|nr:carbohydrate kinase [Acetobacteraceae bacterium KSS12]
MTGSILCCGEALIDFIPVDTADHGRAYSPCPGGSLYNVARALGRLRVPTHLACGMSTDFFGDQLLAGLRQSEVGTGFVQRLEAPTTLGFVTLDRAEPAYAFFDQGAAERIWQAVPEPDALEGVDALHFGSISLVREPAGSAYEAFFLRESGGRRVISFDPNIRESLVTNEDSFRARLDRLLARADIIKISGADLEWLMPGAAHDDVAARWLADGARLVVITQGANGVTGWTGRTRAHAMPIPTRVVDTVGAGDSFMAGLLAGLHENGLLRHEALAALDEAALHHALAVGQNTASITCSRRGADSPWREELSV